MASSRWDVAVFAGAPAEFDSCSAVAHLDSAELHHEYVVGPACCAPRRPDWVGCSTAAAAQTALLVCFARPLACSGSVSVCSLGGVAQVCLAH